MTPLPGCSASDATDLLSALVRIPSVNPAFRHLGDPQDWFGEEGMAGFVADWLRAAGLDVSLETVAPGRPNVVARLSGREPGPSILWEGHLDTVQVTGMPTPFTPRLADGRLYGRGAVDDKGCLTAFMLALRHLAADPPAGSITFLAAVDEEYRFAGISHHLAQGGRYDLGIAGEPTNLRIVRACKGCLRWHVDAIGRSAHTAKPHEGINAVSAAMALIEGFTAEAAAGTLRHTLLGAPTLVCTGFEAGEGPNTVPGRARLRFDYRYLPGEDGRALTERFESVAAHVAAQGASGGARFVSHAPFIDSSAMDVPATSPVVRRMQAVCRAFGIDPEPEGVPYGSDATKMVNIGGIPTIVFGPGSIDQAHSVDEHVEVAEVATATAMLVAFARAAAG